MRKIKFIITSVISFALVFSLLPVFANTDFAENEAKYKAMCSVSEIAKENKETCRSYAIWLTNKVEDAQSQANKYKGEISKYKDDLGKQIEIAKGYEAMIEDINAEIYALSANIITLENNIRRIEAEIKVREEEISEKDRIIIERMRKTQSDIRFGHEIDFLLKARDFSTLIASASVVNDIMAFEQIQIAEINRLIAKQKEDQDAIVIQQDTVRENIRQETLKKEEVVVLKSEVDIAIANYQRQVNELAALQSQATADAAAVKKQMSSIYKALEEVETSTGFVRPISGGYISARVWAYPAPWSATHLGYDYAAPIGTPIRAAANGVVLASYDACPTIGSINSRCGYPGMGGGGNQVFLLVSVDDRLYGLIYFHFQSGTVISSGQTVAAGQTIGRMGSSGMSTGSHVHAEVLYLGTGSINDYISNWNGRLDHGVGMNISNRCDYNGNSAPCRMDPGKAYGYN